MVTFCAIFTWNKTENKNKLSRVRSTDWKSALREEDGASWKETSLLAV